LRGSGTNFHRSNLLGTLAYFGSPAVALRSQANASSLDATSLYSRAVVPLSDNNATTSTTDTTAVSVTSGLGGTVIAENSTALGGTVSAENTTTTTTAAAPIHGQVTPTPTTGTETGAGGVHVGTTHPIGHVVTGHFQAVGDPHFTDNNGQEWTQTGIPGNCYLVASGNGVFLSALYGQAGGWNYCTMQCAQLTIPADAAAGINSEVQISYGLYDQSQVQISTTDANGNVTTQNYNANDFGNNGTMTFGSGTGAVSVNFQGDVLTVNTQTSTGQAGSMTVDSSGQLYLEVSCQGTFDNASGLMQYVASESAAGVNFSNGQSTMDAYAEANYNLTALGGTDSAFLINPNGMPGFQQWVNSTDPNTGQSHAIWNQAFSN